jgi:hypothetical protein
MLEQNCLLAAERKENYLLRARSQFLERRVVELEVRAARAAKAASRSRSKEPRARSAA